VAEAPLREAEVVERLGAVVAGRHARGAVAGKRTGLRERVARALDVAAGVLDGALDEERPRVEGRRRQRRIGGRLGLGEPSEPQEGLRLADGASARPPASRAAW
jgi:hypothetical protein